MARGSRSFGNPLPTKRSGPQLEKKTAPLIPQRGHAPIRQSGSVAKSSPGSMVPGQMANKKPATSYSSPSFKGSKY